MQLSTRPFLVVYVAWHPSFAGGPSIAKRLYDHYRRNLYENVAGGTGLSVVYRSIPEPGSVTPMAIDLEEAETSAIVVLVNEHLVQDEVYAAWLRSLIDQTAVAGLRARLFPVAVDATATKIGIAEQAVRWDSWADTSEDEPARRLIAGLTYQFCRMLRSYLERLKRPGELDAALEQYLKKVQIFLSHSKHDANGERIAKLIRDHIYGGGSLASFFDVHDIPPGLRFDDVILHQVRVSAVVAIYTDSYSSREWCRREIIEAKRANTPLVIANCITHIDERGFPYMGNVPVVRMDPATADRIDEIVSRLLDEVLKDFLWRCRVELSRREGAGAVVFLPRPPELISLAALPNQAEEEVMLVYPDPPLGAEEQRLFAEVAPKVRLRSLTEWLAEPVR
jgi:hypothetical protein